MSEGRLIRSFIGGGLIGAALVYVIHAAVTGGQVLLLLTFGLILIQREVIHKWKLQKNGF